MKRRLIDWIWHIRGSVALAPGQTDDEAFARLAPLFRQDYTSHERSGGMFTFRKGAQAPQDKMSIFDGGVLTVEQGAGGPVLRYDMFSRILLFCFILPAMFIGFGQLTVAIGNMESASSTAEQRDKKDAEKEVERPQHWIDKALGAPAPEKPKSDDEKKKDGEKKKSSPTTAYVFAGIFALLYVIGRILEDRLIRARFRKLLHEG